MNEILDQIEQTRNEQRTLANFYKTLTNFTADEDVQALASHIEQMFNDRQQQVDGLVENLIAMKSAAIENE